MEPLTDERIDQIITERFSVGAFEAKAMASELKNLRVEIKAIREREGQRNLLERWVEAQQEGQP